MSRGKELAKEFVAEIKNGVDDRVALKKPLYACMEHVLDLWKNKNLNTNGAISSAMDEGISMWKCFAREVNKIIDQDCVREAGFLDYVKHSNPEMYELYLSYNLEIDYWRKKHDHK